MKFIKFLAIGLGLGFFQGSLEVAWSLGGTAPDLPLLYVLWLGMNRQTSAAFLVAFVSGLTMDTVAPFHHVGVQSLCKVVVAYLPEWTHYVLLHESRLAGYLVVAVGAILHQIILFTLVATLRSADVWGTEMIFEVGMFVLLNLIVWTPAAVWYSPVVEHGRAA